MQRSCLRGATSGAFLLFTLILITAIAQAQRVTTSSGGSIRTDLGHGIILNKESALNRVWITIHDDGLPVAFMGAVGIKTTYAKGGSYSAGNYQYSSAYGLATKDATAAVEIRFLVFDIWGQHKRSLSATHIGDAGAGTTKQFDSKWNLYSEHEASEHYASIAYVARVRTQDGRILAANTRHVIEQARKFSAQFSENDLTPKSEQK